MSQSSELNGGHLSCECPYCGSQSFVPLDIWEGTVETISDCENCCRPFRLFAVVEGGELIEFQVDP